MFRGVGALRARLRRRARARAAQRPRAV